MVLSRWVVQVGLLAILIAGCGSTRADDAATERAPQKVADAAHARKLQEVLDVQRDGYGASGMAAAIVVRGRLFWSGGSGVSNREKKTRVTADTPFPIFSLTKMFIGALAAKLAQQGQLELDDPISGALPQWPNASRITLRMLLDQTSGVGGHQRRMEHDVDARPRAIWTPRKTLAYSRRPHGTPGERWEYNNANYVLAGLVIEKTTGSTVAKTLRRLILDPLKLDDAVLQPQEMPREVPARAYGGPAPIARALRIGGRYAPYPSEASSEWTAGGMVASAPSVARFADALLRGDLLSPDWRRQVLQFVPAGENYVSYGLGVGEGVTATGEQVWGHFGAGPRFSTCVFHFPETATTVVVLMSGRGNLVAIADLLADAALKP